MDESGTCHAAMTWPGADTAAGVEEKTVEGKAAKDTLRRSEEKYRLLFECCDDAVLLVRASDDRVVDANPRCTELLGFSHAELTGMAVWDLHPPEEHARALELKKRAECEGRLQGIEGLHYVRRDGALLPINLTVALAACGPEPTELLLFRDSTERDPAAGERAVDRRRFEHLAEKRSEELLEAQRRILQNEKLASLGRLAAGVAHEINTPIQYVGDNVRALSDFFTDLTSLVARYRDLIELTRSGKASPEAIEDIAAAEEQYDLKYIMEDAPKAIEQGLEGVGRVAHIVRAMKDFSHMDRGELASVDINHALQNTLTVTRNEYKYVADVVTDFGELPCVECYPSELNQVFLNLVVNAAHAIEDTGNRGTITVRTRLDGDDMEVTIADTGTGIPEEVRDKVFDPFFTTKEVGRGTGQGLNLAHQIVVNRHGGSLTFETEVGKGTSFVVRLPVKAEMETALTLDEQGHE